MYSSQLNSGASSKVGMCAADSGVARNAPQASANSTTQADRG